jgi:hypothetical protein
MSAARARGTVRERPRRHKEDIMRNAKRSLIGVALLASAVAWLPAGQVAAADHGKGAIKLEGAWVAKVKDYPLPLQWSYVLVPDASGRRASLHGTIDVGLAIFGQDVTMTPLIGEVVMTGPASGKFNSVWYERVAGPSPLTSTILFIGVNRGEIKFIGQGKVEGTHNIAFYEASSDVDGDGYPDPGATLYAGPLVFKTIDTRLPPP